MGKFSPNITGNYLLAYEKYNHRGEVVIHGDQRVTWGMIGVRAKKIANALISMGIKKGDMVAFMFHNTPEFIELILGIQVAGAVPAPMNYRFVAREIEFQADHCDATVFIFDDIWKKEVEKAASKLARISHFVCKGKTSLKGAMEYEDFVASGGDWDPAIPTAPQDPCVMIYTGGTTGLPKGVLLSYTAHVKMHSAVIGNLISRLSDSELTSGHLESITRGVSVPGIDLILPISRTKPVRTIMKSRTATKALKKVLGLIMEHPEVLRLRYKNTVKYMFPSLPLFHDASFGMFMLGVMMGNLCFVLVPGVKFVPEKVLETIQKEKVFFVANVPFAWKKLASLKGQKKFDTSSVGIAATGAGICTLDLKKKIFSQFPNTIILDIFGQTEMTPTTAFKLDSNTSSLKERSVGRSIVEAKVVDERGIQVPDGEPGEILYKSETMMLGYYKDEEKTDEAMSGGWFKSGDLGYIDSEGEIRVIDRKKECINTGGEKVFPLEVEEVIDRHPAVEHVCVIGVPDPEWGSRLRAVIQPMPGKTVTNEEVIEFCRGELAGYKIPRSIALTDEFPLSPVGKVLRNKIRDQFGNADKTL